MKFSNITYLTDDGAATSINNPPFTIEGVFADFIRGNFTDCRIINIITNKAIDGVAEILSAEVLKDYSHKEYFIPDEKYVLKGFI